MWYTKLFFPPLEVPRLLSLQMAANTTSQREYTLNIPPSSHIATDNILSILDTIIFFIANLHCLYCSYSIPLFQFLETQKRILAVSVLVR